MVRAVSRISMGTKGGMTESLIASLVTEAGLTATEVKADDDDDSWLWQAVFVLQLAIPLSKERPSMGPREAKDAGEILKTSAAMRSSCKSRWQSCSCPSEAVNAISVKALISRECPAISCGTGDDDGKTMAGAATICKSNFLMTGIKIKGCAHFSLSSS